MATVEDAMERAACVALASWLTHNRPHIEAVELDGAGEHLWAITALRLDGAVVSIFAVPSASDPELWEAAGQSWSMYVSLGRADRRVVSASESSEWYQE